MADYHPLIARAVSTLEKDTAENRRVLYERARTALVAQLRGTIPALEESEITRERLALEEAIRKVEVESARRAREAPKSDSLIAKRAVEVSKALAEVPVVHSAPPPPPPLVLPEPVPPVIAEVPIAVEPQVIAEPPIVAETLTVAPEPVTSEPVAPEPIENEPVHMVEPARDVVTDVLRSRNERAALIDDALKEFREVARGSSDQAQSDRAAPPENPAFLSPTSSPPPPPSSPPARPSFLAPVPPPPPPRPSFLAPLPHLPPPPPPLPEAPQPFVRSRFSQTPPLQPSASPPPSSPRLDALQEFDAFLPKLPAEESRMPVEEWSPPPAEQARPMPNYESDEESPRFSPRQAARQEDVHERVPRSLRDYRRPIWIAIVLFVFAGCAALVYWQGDFIMQAARGLSPFRGATTQVQRETTPTKPKISDRLGQPDSVTASKSGAAITQRAMLTTEPDASNPRGKDYVGTANWRTETTPAGQGRPAEVAIKLEVEIPDRGFFMTWTIRRNTDATLPASHTIDIEFNLAANSPLGKILEIKSLLMKQPGQIEGSPLWGNAQRSTPNYFLVGLSAAEADAQYNLQLLKAQPAFDVALVFSNVRRAFLLIEKGPGGERVFAEAFAAWKQ